MRAMTIIVPTMPPIYIRFSIDSAELPLQHDRHTGVGALPYIDLIQGFDFS